MNKTEFVSKLQSESVDLSNMTYRYNLFVASLMKLPQSPVLTPQEIAIRIDLIAKHTIAEGYGITLEELDQPLTLALRVETLTPRPEH